MCWQDEPDAQINSEGHKVIEVLVTWAGYLLGHSRHIEHLHTAVTAQRLVGQAVGLTMATHGLSADAAFTLLSQRSQNENRKLRDVAQQTIDAHDTTLQPDRPVAGDIT